MNDATPNDADGKGLPPDHRCDRPGHVESGLSEYVTIVTVNEPGDNTARPAPDYVKRALDELRRKLPPDGE
jgi:hypothetical protein